MTTAAADNATDWDNIVSEDDHHIRVIFDQAKDLDTVWFKLAQRFATGSGAVLMSDQVVYRRHEEAGIDIASVAPSDPGHIQQAFTMVVKEIVTAFVPGAQLRVEKLD